MWKTSVVYQRKIRSQNSLLDSYFFAEENVGKTPL